MAWHASFSAVLGRGAGNDDGPFTARLSKNQVFAGKCRAEFTDSNFGPGEGSCTFNPMNLLLCHYAEYIERLIHVCLCTPDVSAGQKDGSSIGVPGAAAASLWGYLVLGDIE
jgi:hypothetical protein